MTIYGSFRFPSKIPNDSDLDHVTYDCAYTSIYGGQRSSSLMICQLDEANPFIPVPSRRQISCMTLLLASLALVSFGLSIMLQLNGYPSINRPLKRHYKVQTSSLLTLLWNKSWTFDTFFEWWVSLWMERSACMETIKVWWPVAPFCTLPWTSIAMPWHTVGHAKQLILMQFGSLTSRWHWELVVCINQVPWPLCLLDVCQPFSFLAWRTKA